MQNRISDKIRMQHILDSISEIESYTQGASFSGFMQNSMMRFACIKQLEIIGEAAARLTGQIKQKYSKIHWREIIGLRNILIHEYFGVDEQIVWEIIQNDLPEFKKELEVVINEIGESSEK